jgi:broad specificity polyphosphatase/5'/3'-nucleotidase SurE
MQGVNWESDKAGVEAIAKEIESSYSKDRGKAAISKLANSSWKLIKDVDTTPYGARDVMNTNTPSNDSTLSDKELAKRIKDDTEKLKKTDPNLYDKIKNSLPESSKLRRKHHD